MIVFICVTCENCWNVTGQNLPNSSCIIPVKTRRSRSRGCSPLRASKTDSFSSGSFQPRSRKSRILLECWVSRRQRENELEHT
jgi:hypothetical protein